MPVTTIHHAGICVRNMDESLRFYRDGLGLTILTDTVLNTDLAPLLGVRTESVRTVFLGDTDRPDSGIVELLDLGIPEIGAAEAPTGLPVRGIFLVSFQVDVPTVLSRLGELGLAGTPRTIPTPGGGQAATVTDPDGVMVELLPRGRLSIMK